MIFKSGLSWHRGCEGRACIRRLKKKEGKKKKMEVSSRVDISMSHPRRYVEEIFSFKKCRVTKVHLLLLKASAMELTP